MIRLVGKRFGRLTLDAIMPPIEGHRMAKVTCSCGMVKTIRLESVRRGNTRSCGCLMRESASTTARKFLTTHGQAAGKKTRTYRIWKGIHTRCNSPTIHNAATYIGRGISVCKRWLSFENFFADMGECPKGMSIDRIDNNGNYEPNNCRWATPTMQAVNRSMTKWVYVNGERLPFSHACTKLNACESNLREKMRRSGESHQSILDSWLRSRGK